MQRTKGKERVISKTCSQQISPSKFRASQYTPLTVRLPKDMNSIRMNEDTTMRIPHRNGHKKTLHASLHARKIQIIKAILFSAPNRTRTGTGFPIGV